MESSVSVTETVDLPSHILVQNQMQDIIFTQKNVIEKLSQDLSSHEDFMRESFASKSIYEEELKNLQKSIRDDYVPRSKLEEAENDLQEERLSHLNTKKQLNDVSDRLEFALGEIEVVTKQIEREKAAFQKAFGTVQTKAIQETSKSIKLERKYTDVTKQCEKQQDDLESKTEELKFLEGKVKEQEVVYKKKLNELEIQKKQDRYIAKMMEDQSRRKNKTKTSLLTQK
ncbi:spermatogenesis-associated protein 24-like [Mytilus galloprovincialis]|uniref:spermatogenesis-associated protein 24-like n=1 Tax=Mytilus galloprovincialis TaxID=29158 RepID=UPI003F7C3627